MRIVQAEVAADQPGFDGSQLVERLMQFVKFLGCLQIVLGTVPVSDGLFQSGLLVVVIDPAIRRPRDHRMIQELTLTVRDLQARAERGRSTVIRRGPILGSRLAADLVRPDIQPEHVVGHADQRKVGRNGPLDRVTDPVTRIR